MGYIRVAKGNNALHLEDQCAWAVPDVFTAGNPSFGTGPALVVDIPRFPMLG